MSACLAAGVTGHALLGDSPVKSVAKITLRLARPLASDTIRLQELFLTLSILTRLAVIRVVRAAGQAWVVAFETWCEASINRSNRVLIFVIEEDFKLELGACEEVGLRVDRFENDLDVTIVVSALEVG